MPVTLALEGKARVRTLSMPAAPGLGVEAEAAHTPEKLRAA